MKKIFSLLSFLFAQYCYAQSALRMQHINVEDGLSQSSVYSTFQDAHGFMWFATGDGLNRYDGKEFISYKSRLIDSLPGLLKDRNINSLLYEDKQNRLWFTSDAGVYCLDKRTGKFHVLINKYETDCASMIIGVDDHFVWAGVPRKGIYSIDLRSLQCRLYPFTDSFQTSRREITNIVSGRSNSKGLWITDARGLLYFDKQKLRDQRVLLKEKINNECLLGNGRILLSVVNGVWIFDPGNGNMEFIPITIPGQKMANWSSIAEDTIQHFVYIGEALGSHICKLDMTSRKYELLVCPTKYVDRIYIDKSRNLWIGTDGDGVYKLDIKPPKFFCYAPNAGVNETFMVKSIYRDDSGMIWMGVFNHGLVKYDPITGRQQRVPLGHINGDQLISTVMKDSSGDILTTLNGTVLWLNGQSGKITRQITLPFYKQMSPAKPLIYAITEWKKGHYLVGTNIGLYTINNVAGKLAATIPAGFANDSFINGWTYNFYRADDGTIYIGERRGFARIRMLNDSVHQLLDYGLINLPIRHFYKNKTRHIVWMATEQGLVAYNEQTKKHIVFDEDAGLSNSYIYSILAQNDSALWISSNNGLYNVQINYRNDFDIKAKFINYTAQDGLQSNEFNTGAYFQCNDGTFIFGGIAGINWFKPEAITYNPNKALPAITAVSVNDTLYAKDTAIFLKNIELSYTKNTISLTLKALEFTKPEQNMFAYKLEGLDKDWVYTTNDKIRYSHLAPGSYTFLLKVRNNELEWNEAPLALSIIIHPPYWGTWWFRSMIVIAVILLIYLITRYIIHQRVMTKTRELEKQHALNMERLRISKDVHDDIGSGLSKISLISALANKKINGNEIIGKDIQHISSISKELVENMRDLIWVLNPENTTLDNLVSRMREYCADYLDGMNINTILNFPENIPVMPISREAQRNIFSTVKEAMNNCVKHAGATEIKISLDTNNDALTIIICDNGKGIDDDSKRAGGNGLRNMKQRIGSLGGSYMLSSSPGNGTSITIVIRLEKLNLGITESIFKEE